MSNAVSANRAGPDGLLAGVGALRSRYLLASFSALRLPLLVVGVYLVGAPILIAIEPIVGIADVTHFVISVASTPMSRALFFVGLLAVFWLCLRFTRTLPQWLSAGICFAVGGAIVLGTLRASDVGNKVTLLILVILATNLSPDALVSAVTREGRTASRWLAIAVGVAELFFLGWFVDWLWRNAFGRAPLSRQIRMMLGTGLVAFLDSLLISGSLLVNVEQAVRMSSAARILQHGNFNGLAIDRNDEYLYAVGHGLSGVRRYDLRDPTGAPVTSSAGISRAQSLAYVPDRDEIYAYNNARKAVRVFETPSLRLKREIPVADLAPGDPWIAVDPESNTVTVVSEADSVPGMEAGSAFVIMDLGTGKVLGKSALDAGNLWLHPSKPILYLSFFRRVLAVIAYDLVERKELRRLALTHRIARLVYWEQGDEVLAALPTQSKVLRLDAETLEPKGEFDVTFGVRTLAIDPERNLLLGGSLANGNVVVIDLETGRKLRSFYVGPWLRTIALRPSEGIAYVSSNGALYELNYARDE